MGNHSSRGLWSRPLVLASLHPARGTLARVLLAAVLCLGAGPVRGAQEPIPNDKCLECHSDKDLTKETTDGKELSMFVDEAVLLRSAHKKDKCWDCHRDLTDEHPDDGAAAKPVDCTRCHENATRSFQSSVHGLAIRKGSETAANCKDCHGNHDVIPANRPDSPLHFTRQAKTCGECHEQEALDVAESIHGKAAAKGIHEAPTCTDCHSEHRIHSLSGANASREVSSVCSRCHESERINTKFGLPSDRRETFFESYHGLAVKGGSTNAANCASCHGYHKILPSTDPGSTIHKRHLVETCGKCHPGAGENFALGEVHLKASGNGSLGSKINHWVKVAYVSLIVVVIGGMVLHNGLSWLRALRIFHQARGATVLRMNLHQRIQHFVLVISFVMLALSGFALKYPESFLGWLFGGDESIRRWAHRAAGVVMLGGASWHLGYIIATKDGRKLARDFLPGVRDIKDVAVNLKYFVGKSAQHPRFGRFGYIEKLEYWAVLWGTLIMGITGLMIWFKIDVTWLLPRWFVEVATTIHFYEAILACLAIVVWHFYHVLFAPGVYPMNFAWWDGRVSRETHEKEHPLDLDALAPPGKARPPSPEPLDDEPDEWT